MTEPNASMPPARGVQAARQTAGELAQMIQLRRELAELEIAARSRIGQAVPDRRWHSRRAGRVRPAPAVDCRSLGLAQVTEIGTARLAVFFGAVLVLPGTVAIVLSVRRLRAEFCGLRNTLAELHEDLVWIREWANQETDHPWGAR